MIITRGFVDNSIILRGMGSIRRIVRELLLLSSKIVSSLTLRSKLW